MAETYIDKGQLRLFYGAVEAVSTVSTTNITLSGLQNLNGATGADGDRVFVTGQTTSTEDGIYLMRAGAWERAEDAPTTLDLGSMLFRVEDGTFAGQLWNVTTAKGSAVIGTDAIAIALVVDPSATMNTRVFGEELSYTPNDFTGTVSNAPIAGLERVYRNGVRQNEGIGNDYTLSGSTFTFTKKLTAGTVVLVDYEY
jgi:phage-related tail fiber protein